MSRVYVISDTHFGHRNILKYRDAFYSIEEHDRTIVDNILHICGKRDSLWMLGDMFFTRDALCKYGKLISDNVGYTHLILGNHDTDNSARAANVELMCDIFGSVRALHSKRGAWLSHAPLHPQELRGKINVHGHVHGATINDDRYVNVCVENTGYVPIELQLILDGWRGH